jgi:hypothetical protein
MLSGKLASSIYSSLASRHSIMLTIHRYIMLACMMPVMLTSMPASHTARLQSVMKDFWRACLLSVCHS